MMVTRGKAPPVAGARPSAATAAAAAAVLACLAAAFWLASPRCAAPTHLGGTAAGGGAAHASLRVTPFSLPAAERLWAYEATRLDLPTLVSRPRRLLTLQLALAALLGGVPGDFVETGVFTGGTSILMMKALERHDPAWAAPGGGGTSDGSSGGSSSSDGGAADAGSPAGSSSGGGGGSGGGITGRRMWAADSFQGTPAPVDQDQGGGGLMRTG